MSDVARGAASAPSFLDGDGEMARRIREHDWAATPLGPVETWPQGLRTLVDVMLGSPGPLSILWGPDHIQLYNDAYILIAAERHPGGLGRPAAETWSDAYTPFLRPIFERVFAGEAVTIKDQVVRVRGTDEEGTAERFFTASFSPIRDGTGTVAGIFHPVTETTDRVSAERRLREGEARLQGVLEGMGEAFGLLDRDFRVLSFNEAALRLETRPLGEIVGRSHWEVYPGSEHSEIGRLYKRALAEQQPVALEHRYTWEDGTARWLEMRAYPVPEGLAIFWRDASERKEAEEALRESEARVRLALQAGQLAEVTFDLDGGGVSHSAAFAELLGHPPDKRLTLAEFRAQYHPEDRDRVLAARAAILASDQSFYEIEKRIIRPDGEVRWLYGRGSVDRDAQGKAVSVTVVYLDDTERKQTEFALRESEERFRAIVDTATDYAIFTTDPDGGIETWPAGAQAVFGWSAEEAVGQPDALIFTPEDRAQGMPDRERQQARDTGQSPNVRWHLRKDGSRVFIEGIARPLRSGDGTVTGFVQVGQDVTDQRRAEAALRDSEAQFRAFAQAVPNHVWAARPDGALYWFNEQVYAYCGEPPGSLDGAEWARIVHPEDRPSAAATWAQAVASGDVYATEFRIRRGDGRFRWFLVRAEPVHGAGGSILNWVGTNTDIDDRRRAEAALQDLNGSLEAQVAARTAERDRVWANSRDLLVIVGTDGVFRAVNPAWTTLLGWDADELVGRSFLDFILPDDHPSSQGALATASREELPLYENRYRHKNGSHRWISWLAAPEGDLIYAYGRDVTAEKARQAELDAAHEALRQSQKMEAMGSLTGGVAHDFNNLLTPIIASLDMLLRRGLGSTRERRLMNGALQSAERAKTLVQRLLAFARRQPLQPGPVDVAELVHGMAELLASTTGPRIDVRVDVPADLPPALADAHQLEMALLNLAVNARDAMPEGGVLTIAASQQSVGGSHAAGLRVGHYVRVSVTDTGVGMDEATLVRAIEPFFSTKGVGRGTGLGLSMVHGLASQLGGGLTIASSPGRGTTVELWLPVSTMAAEGNARAFEAGPAHEGRGTALLVDDEDLVRMSTADMLQDLGYEVVEASSAEEALRLIDQGLAPDLVVTDHLMPGLTGVDLARDLLARRPGLPVLIVSGYAEVEGIAPGLPRLTKPFRSAELAAHLTALMPAGT